MSVIIPPMKFRFPFRLGLLLAAFALIMGCSSAGKHREKIDKTALKIIEQKQMEALGRTEPFSIEKPEDTLRKRLMIDQNLPYSSNAVLGLKNLDPIAHWPNDPYLLREQSIANETVSESTGPLVISLLDALQIAAENSRQYQNAKESVFQTALRLDLQRDRYRNTFFGAFDSNTSANLGGNETTSGVENTFAGEVSRTFLNGVGLSAQIGLDLVKMLSPNSASSRGLFGDASITIPLLRGAGRHIASEPLTLAERDAVYAIYDFERYKKTFAVDIATRYFSVLQALDSVENSENNYRRVVRSTRFMKRSGDAGIREPAEVDQAIQSELSSRNNWIRSKISYQRSLDSFKTQLGLPPDARITLDPSDLKKLSASAESIISGSGENIVEGKTPPADAEVVLKEPSADNAGPYEIDEDQAIQLAFKERLDLRIAQGDVFDAQRAIVIAADDLRAELTLMGNTSVGEGRSLGSANEPNSYDLNFQKGRYNALITLDLPIERTAEIVGYRESIIGLERAIRNLQETEDNIKLDVRDRLNDLQQYRESLRIEAEAVKLADRRVKNMELSIQAGRLTIRDLLEAQSDLLASQNGLTANLVDYRIGELALQRDLGILNVNEKGIWKEFPPEDLNHERTDN